MIRRIQTDFVPLALRASLMNNAQSVNDSDEQWLYQRVSRAKLAPQGICVLNSAGQVLAWVQMFDDDKSVLNFLDHTLKRCQEQTDPRQPVTTERYMHFPSEKVGEARDDAKLPAEIAEAHVSGKRCPAADGKGKVRPGTLIARLVGRALDDRGQPVADTVKQEHYVEDQINVVPEISRKLAQTLARAGQERIRLPDEFAKLCAGHAHLGHIDVQPCICMIKGQAENKGEWKRCELWAKPMASRERKRLEVADWEIDGESDVLSSVAINGNGVHNVRLAWHGFIEIKGMEIGGFVLSARGTEKLQFAKDDHPLAKNKRDEVMFLPAGRPIDQESGVRYGIIGEVASAGEPETRSGGPDSGAQIPDEARKPLIEALGGPFLVFRDKVQDELKLSDEQKHKLLATFPEHVQATMQFFERAKDLQPEEREQAVQVHRRKSEEKLAALLANLLDSKQRERLFQLQLQQAGAFALIGEDEAFLKLEITGEQRKKFMEVVREMERKIPRLIKEAETRGSPEELRVKVAKLRKDHEAKIVAILSDTQKKQWQELLGKPYDLGD